MTLQDKVRQSKRESKDVPVPTITVILWEWVLLILRGAAIEQYNGCLLDFRKAPLLLLHQQERLEKAIAIVIDMLKDEEFQVTEIIPKVFKIRWE